VFWCLPTGTVTRTRCNYVMLLPGSSRASAIFWPARLFLMRSW